MARKLTQEEKAFLLNTKQEDITKEWVEANFVSHYDKEKKKVIPARLSWQDEFSLKKGEYSNTTDIPKTNVGLFVINKFLYEGILQDVLGYVNEPYTADNFSATEGKICTALMEDKITTHDYFEYQNRLQWMLAIHTMVCSSYSKGIIAPNKKVIAYRDKLFKENKEELDKGNAVVAAKIEKELLKFAHDELKNDPAMEIYDSNARGSFGNGYKNMNIMKGANYDPVNKRFVIAKHGFSEGIEKEHLPYFANSIQAGAYPKAVGTAVGGYTVKRFNAAFQGIVLGKKGSDCGSKRYLEIELTSKNVQDYMFRYMVEGSRLIELTRENMGKYIGKKIKIRTPLFCTSKKICNKCYGNKPYMVGIENVGLTFSTIGSNFVNLGMKSFHDQTIKLGEINPNDMLL